MKIFRKTLIWLISICAGIYLAICVYFYLEQDNALFPGVKLSANYKFKFSAPFDEYHIKTREGDTLSAGLFTVPGSKGLIFFLHGNGGNLQTWGTEAKEYNALGYDLFIMDYPGYGKSTGHLQSQQQLFDAVSSAYNFIRSKYTEDHIIILGYSIGTGPAAWLASQNHPQKLILLAPYYSLTDLVHHYYPFLPAFLSKYTVNTYQYIQNTTAPVIIFHGDIDEVIYYRSSLKLKRFFKPGDTLITLHNQKHNDIPDNKDYLNDLKSIL